MKKRFIFLLIILFLIIYSFIIEPNFIVDRKYVNITSDKISNDVKFIQISDLHMKKYYFFDDIILNKIRKVNPDFILYTGDSLVKNTDQESLNKFFKKLSDIADVYLIYGNWDYQDLKKVNQAYSYENIHLIDGKSEIITVKNTGILLTGLPMFYHFKNFENYDNLYSIFLTHVPDNIKKHNDLIKYSDLILAGHTHGGQIYIPFLTKFLINKIGNYSEYLKGMHKYKNSELYINRGLGSWLSVRFLTPPEITVFNLKGE